MKKRWMMAVAMVMAVGAAPVLAAEEGTAAAKPETAAKADKGGAEPTTAKGWFEAGHAKMEEGDIDGAIEAFGKAKEACRPENKKDRAWAANNIGLCQIRANKYDDARATLEEATGLDASNATAWNNLGTVYLHTNEFEKGASAFESALKVKPDSPKAKANLAYAKSMLAEQGGGEKAAETAPASGGEKPAAAEPKQP